MTPRRGDVVLLASPRIGFGRPTGGELALVLQVDRATQLLGTLIVAPVDSRFDPQRLLDFDVVIPAADLGGRVDHVAHVHLLRSVLVDAVQGEPIGAAGREAMKRALRAERLLLG